MTEGRGREKRQNRDNSRCRKIARPEEDEGGKKKRDRETERQNGRERDRLTP